MLSDYNKIVLNIINWKELSPYISYLNQLFTLTKGHKEDLIELTNKTRDLTYYISYFAYNVFVNIELEQLLLNANKRKVNIGTGELEVLLIMLLNKGNEMTIKNIESELIEKKSLVRLNMIVDTLIKKGFIELSHNHGKVFYYRTIF